MTWRRAKYKMNHGTPGARDTSVSDRQIEQRVYRTGENKWPRLTLTTWKYPGGVHLSVSRKMGVHDYWAEQDIIPPELIDDAIEMLAAAKTKVSG